MFALAAGAAPLKVAVFVGSGARNVGAFRWLELATMAEGVEAAPVDGASVRAGALEGMDMVVMPGGRASMEAAAPARATSPWRSARGRANSPASRKALIL